MCTSDVCTCVHLTRKRLTRKHLTRKHLLNGATMVPLVMSTFGKLGPPAAG
jgi:hypothetical protein